MVKTLRLDICYPHLSFSSVDNALQALIGILTQCDSELQHHAAWCITNICTGNHQQTLQVTRLAAPYCITYLSGQNLAMQVCML